MLKNGNVIFRFDVLFLTLKFTICLKFPKELYIFRLYGNWTIAGKLFFLNNNSFAEVKDELSTSLKINDLAWKYVSSVIIWLIECTSWFNSNQFKFNCWKHVWNLKSRTEKEQTSFLNDAIFSYDVGKEKSFLFSLTVKVNTCSNCYYTLLKVE